MTLCVEDVIASGQADAGDEEKLLRLTTELMEQRLAAITRTAPAFAAALRGYRQASTNGEGAVADGLLAWLAGQPNVAASVKRSSGIKGEVDHYGALSFLQGLLTVLRDSGRPGLILVLDEVETLQRVRGDIREKGLNALRQLIDEVDAGRFPGLYLLITGTPSFFESPQGVHKLERALHLSDQSAAEQSGNKAGAILRLGRATMRIVARRHQRFR